MTTALLLAILNLSANFHPPWIAGAADEAQDSFYSSDGEQAQPGERAELGHGIDPWG